jgi:hypothetical protein
MLAKWVTLPLSSVMGEIETKFQNSSPLRFRLHSSPRQILPFLMVSQRFW